MRSTRASAARTTLMAAVQQNRVFPKAGASSRGRDNSTIMVCAPSPNTSARRGKWRGAERAGASLAGRFPMARPHCARKAGPLLALPV